MNEFEKPTQSNIEGSIPTFETLIVKDRTAIEARHKEIVDKMLIEEIPAEPNIGNLEGLYYDNTIFLGLSGLKERYGDKWLPIAETLSGYLNQEGGKRLRSLLILNGYRTFTHGVEPSQEIINAAVGIEIINDTALLLDDVMDNSTLRRGAPSLWARIENLSDSSTSNATRTAVDFGPLCFSWARHLMVDEINEKTRPQVNKIFWETVANMKHGETEDIKSTRTNEWPAIEHVLEQFDLKTTSYSIRLPLLFALHASGTKIDNNILQGIEVFSRGFGLAFQLHDDLLITKTNNEIGKDSTIDAFNGTKIPVVILARQLGNNEEINFIDQVWGNPALLTPDNILRLKKIFETTGALQKIVEMMKLEIGKAKTGLDMIAQSGFDVSSLRHLLNTGLPWMDDLNTPIENHK